MRRLPSLAASALLLIATVHAVAPPLLCLSNVGIIDGNGDSVVVPSQSIVVSAFGTIVDIFLTGSKPLPSNCRRVLDLTGHYLSPGAALASSASFSKTGLIDSHIHTSSEWPQDEKHMKEILDWTLRGGLTTLRDMGGGPKSSFCCTLHC